MFALIILSSNYASSTWCLDELQKILECKKEVFPIFLGVDPSDVRHQRGSFAKAFRDHEEKFREEKKKVETWRHTLREVASYSGWDSKDKHEAALIETIVGHIQKKVIPGLPCCTDNLVGIDSRMKEMYSLMGIRLKDVRLIGIWGRGGIGKTTIARKVYEAIKGDFDVSCFLENIREVSKTNGLVHIQKELSNRDVSCFLEKRKTLVPIVEDFLGDHLRIVDFDNLHDGKMIIANSLSNKKVLVVLDDVSELSQLENLAGKQEWFGPGSRVIITTRDKHLLKTHGVHLTCKARALAQNEALQLICLKAFKRDQPKKGYLNLCKEMIEYARGLPLALEVLGSHLHGRNVEVWHSALEQIRSFPHSKIQDKLKISYDSLQPPYQKMFLDIACFFKGMDIDEVKNILRNCGDYPEIGIDILIERCLVTLDRVKNKLGMHDLLQEMGRNIVFEESPNDPGKRSRLWSEKDIDYVLTKNKGTDKIQGMVLNLVQPYDSEVLWNTGAFSKMGQLRLLKLCDMQLPLGLNCLPSALQVLHWRGCPLKALPLWHGTKLLEKLKCIDLSFSKNLKQSPDFDAAPNLESLVLEGCTSLTEVHPSLVCHKKLAMMNLEDCKRLKTLPSNMEMSSLKYLNLSGCSEFKYLPEFGESMEQLSLLILKETPITKLPSSLGCLVGLAHLNLKNCKNLVCLPDTFHKLKSLKFLDVRGCSKLCSLPDGLEEMKCLEQICLSADDSVELPSSAFNLENLQITFEKTDPTRNNFVTLPSCISKLTKLELLILNLCKKLQRLPELPSSMQQLDASNCTSLETSKFNPSKPRSLFASPAKLHFPRELKGHLPRELIGLFENMQELCLPKTRFGMFITGSEIPSWFVPRKSVSFAKIAVPHNCPVNEWVGFALCFLLVSYAVPPEACRHEVDCYLFGPNGKKIISSRNLLPMEPCCPHLYSLYLSIDKYRDMIYEGGDGSEVEFVQKSYCCQSLGIVRCGCRLVCKQDVQDIYGNNF
ncbi:TMV resistance protein N [Glycine soja]|uniref:ADP-ribosyl cyclase/cyclic ADP-ribose hydrolase n=1 Tax=Glycine soja TaxID=3848 RepID=A0A0B2R402_GLYSO|nr:TMV resistance protein N [Glycine soja]